MTKPAGRHVVIGGLLLLLATVSVPAQGAEREDIYDESADGKALVQDALVRAKAQNKHVLIQWGGNWCGWCHLLHDLFETDKAISKVLSYEYEVVMIDSRNNREYARELGTQFNGVPFLTVLDADGRKLVDQETGSLEIGPRHDPAKVLAFLQKWTPDPLDASAQLNDAKKRAKAEGKHIFVHFGTPWCGWCKRLEAYLGRDDVASVLSPEYVVLKIDQERMTGGADLRRKLSAGQGGGVPWFAVLDADGKVLKTSNGPNGNVGHPVKAHEIDHFISIIHKTSKISDENLNTLRRILEEQDV